MPSLHLLAEKRNEGAAIQAMRSLDLSDQLPLPSFTSGQLPDDFGEDEGDVTLVDLQGVPITQVNIQGMDANNFGQRMMEKVGWSRGTALGKNGEGLLTPLEQRMREGKAGLG
ncbi:hypothetical protein DOTSEDRAFT_22206 [Dothistroma septosporum NZE10]|uniref:G-patch domain-containing protein n=1 Tax=Dothistroma septosporum (strain NZE10 / CBS 128990) TaxID=675120 RepID=N1PRT4_DOTSN|nr:hypothetical protein DOTSEDRAFT_22206 [Dothistroma septosporum NZE10]